MRLIGSNGNKSLLSSLDHALVILEAIGRAALPVGPSEISRKTGYPKTTVHRILHTLVRRDFLRKESQTGRYHLTMKFFEIGGAAVGQWGIKDAAKPRLEALRNLSGETAHLAVMDDDGVFYIDKIESSQSVRMYSYVGRRAPVHCTAVGKALLAYQSKEKLEKFLSQGLKAYTRHTILDRKRLIEELGLVRKRGYALDREELEIGLFCVAAPVRDHSGEVIAAVSISGPGARLSRSRLRALTPLVVKTGLEISAVLGFSEAGKSSPLKTGYRAAAGR